MQNKYTTESFFQLFGHINVFFATIDFIVTLVIYRLLKFENFKNSPINEKTTLKQKFRILKDVKAENVYDLNALKKINNFVDEAIELSEKRNRFIHDQWLFAPDLINEGKIGRLNLNKISMGSFTPQQETHSYEELVEFINKLGNMQKLVNYVFNLLPNQYLINNSNYLKEFNNEQ
ncbi:MAG: hypothetical protein WCZ90_06570 [Melioribacteraceae bacterium]